MTKLTPAAADWMPLMIIGHCAPWVFHRRTAVANCSRPDSEAHTPNTRSTSFMLDVNAAATARVVTELTTMLNVCVGLLRRPPLRRASTALATASHAG
jgi:hypothetical protein